MITKIIIILVGIGLLYLLYSLYSKTKNKFDNITKRNISGQMNGDEQGNHPLEKEIEREPLKKESEVINNIESQQRQNDFDNPKYVFFDISLKDNYKYENLGKILIQLFNKEVPKTCDNFYTLVKDKKYKDILFHRVIKGFMIQGGDITNNDGTGGYSIYGDKFEDENFLIKHNTAGLLSMANSGPNTNGSQFFITTTPTPHLDDKHVVFGRVIDGLETVQLIENQLTDNNDKPIQDCYIKDCGILNETEINNILNEKKKYLNKGKLLENNENENIQAYP